MISTRHALLSLARSLPIIPSVAVVQVAAACGALLIASAITSPALAEEIRFDRDVMAVLSKAGCNAGACHGNLNGKGGFFLSLRGQDGAHDYDQLARQLSGRRLNRVSPADSLILLKATAEVPHQGGQRFELDSPEYDILHRWIAAGHPGPDPDTPELVGLDVAPTDEVSFAPTDSVRLKTIARFSDGTEQDVTRMAVYEPTNHRVEVTADGVVLRQSGGVTTVVVRYLDRQVPVRLAFMPDDPDWQWSDPPANNSIDEHILARLEELRINPAPLADDHTFVRRIYLDLLGVLPTAEEARAFVADDSPDRRALLVDRLLTRPEFAYTWAQKWSDLVRNEEKVLDRRGVTLFHEWMRDSFAEAKPLDRFVYELIASRGSTYENPPANYWRAHREPLVRAETTAQVFLGVRLQCAKCHNHPFDRWTQDEYYDWSALFARVDYEVIENERPDKLDKHEFVGEQLVVIKDEGEVQNARTGSAATPRFLGGASDIEGDRLEALADWLTSPENRQFAAAQTNRIWYHLMGRGLVEPVDDFRLTNPASHPELLEQLTDQLVSSGFDLRQLVRTIVLSRTYQLAARSEETDADDELNYDAQNYDRAILRRLTAEQLLDVQSQVLDVPADFRDYPAGTRAVEIAGVERVRRKKNAGDQFLQLFGKPERILACECERSNEPTLGHALSLIGGTALHERLKHPNNRLARLISSDRSDRQIVDELFWTALSRGPSERELAAASELIQERGDRRQALEDLTWALLNAKELIFRN